MALTPYGVPQTLADDATYTLPAGRGWGWVMLGNAEAFCRFRQDTSGAITIYRDVNFKNSDTDGWACIYDGGASGIVKNRLGASKDMLLYFQCGDGADSLADDATQALHTATAIMTIIEASLGDDDEFLRAYKKTDGTPELIDSTSGVKDSDTDNYFCVYQDYIKNRLGSSQIFEWDENTDLSTSASPPSRTLTGPGLLKVGFQGTGISGYAEIFYDDTGALTWITNTANVIEGSTSGYVRIYSAVSGTISIANNTGIGDIVFFYEYVEASTMALDDTEIEAKTWMDTDSYINVAVSFLASSNPLWDHCRLYRRLNGGTWNYLKDDLTWSTTGSYYEFNVSSSDGVIAYTDVNVTDSKYEYKCTQVNSGSIESSGATDTIYIDEPVVSLAITGGVATTTERGIQLDITGDSGNDSLNTSGEVDHYLIYASDEPSADGIIYKPRNTTVPCVVPFRINTVSGAKTINCYGYDHAGQVSNLTTANITMTLPTTPAVTIDTSKIKFGYYTLSDDFTAGADSTDTGFDADNLKDQRPGIVWKGESIDDYTGVLSADYGLYMSFNSAERIDIAYLKNHNFDSNLLSTSRIYLCANSVLLGSPGLWLAGAAYKVELTGHIAKDLICHRPEETYQFWALIISVTASGGAAAVAYSPYLGRFGLVKAGDIFSPEMDFNDRFTEEYEDNSQITEVDDAVMEVGERNSREKITFDFRNAIRADYDSARNYLGKQAKKSQGIICLPRPDEIQDGTDEPSASDEITVEPIYGQITNNMRLQSGPAGRMDWAVSLREMLGGYKEGEGGY